MKAWEKEYAVHPLDFRMVVEPDSESAGEHLVVADLRVPLGEVHDTARLFAASGKMAKALLDQGATLGGVWHTGRCIIVQATNPSVCVDDCKVAREALEAAGALP